VAILIGQKPDKDFTDPIGVLEDCHRRIEKFLDVLLALAGQTQSSPFRNEQRDAIESALRYFREAAPKHVADEEDSLFPRMRAARHSEALSDLDELHSDHLTVAENHSAVEELFRRWLTDGLLSSPDHEHLISLLQSLRETYARHIKQEETQLFPHAARLLTPNDLKAVGLEMAKRRGLAAAQGFESNLRSLRASDARS
jgi:hemerythrin-like domain-containing protein